MGKLLVSTAHLLYSSRVSLHRGREDRPVCKAAVGKLAGLLEVWGAPTDSKLQSKK